MIVQLQLINGLVFGIEHMQEEDNEIAWLIALHLSFFRVVFMKLK